MNLVEPIRLNVGLLTRRVPSLRVNTLHFHLVKYSRRLYSTIYQRLRIVIDLHSNIVIIRQTHRPWVGSRIIHQVRLATCSGVLVEGPSIGIAVHREEGLTPRRLVWPRKGFVRKHANAHARTRNEFRMKRLTTLQYVVYAGGSGHCAMYGRETPSTAGKKRSPRTCSLGPKV